MLQTQRDERGKDQVQPGHMEKPSCPDLRLPENFLFSYTVKHIPAPPYSRVPQFFLDPYQLVVLGDTVGP